MSTAGMILGINAVLLACIPVLGAVVAPPFIAAGLPLSVVGLFRNKNRGQGFHMALAGIITNILALVVILTRMTFFVILNRTHG